MTTDNDPLEEVLLRTGRAVPRAVILSVKITLNAVVEKLNAKDVALEDAYTLYDLVMLARNPEYDAYFSLDTLVNTGLVNEDGVMRSIFRDVVLASTEGEDLDIRLVDPLRATPQP